MSYILDALKKIEQKQQREGGPRLLTIPCDVPEEQKKRPVLPLIIAGALVLNVAIMTAWWIVPWPTQERIPPTEPLSAQKRATSVNSESVPVLPVALPESRSTIQPLTKPVVKSGPAPGAALGQNAEKISTQTPKPGPSAGRQAEAQPRKETGTPSALQRGKLFNLEQLPTAVREVLPEFKISGHAYNTEPRFRVARVNNKIVQEGEVLNQGLKVDEIVPGGVIFTYQGYRFKIGINDK